MSRATVLEELIQRDNAYIEQFTGDAEKAEREAKRTREQIDKFDWDVDAMALPALPQIEQLRDQEKRMRDAAKTIRHCLGIISRRRSRNRLKLRLLRWWKW